eukprot:5249615-Amphidinium_carterae.1
MQGFCFMLWIILDNVGNNEIVALSCSRRLVAVLEEMDTRLVKMMFTLGYFAEMSLGCQEHMASLSLSSTKF